MRTLTFRLSDEVYKALKETQEKLCQYHPTTENEIIESAILTYNMAVMADPRLKEKAPCSTGFVRTPLGH